MQNEKPKSWALAVVWGVILLIILGVCLLVHKLIASADGGNDISRQILNLIAYAACIAISLDFIGRAFQAGVRWVIRPR